jgi:hypothetical protein
MAARDDSVIRGALITCLILLVLSIAMNIFLYLMSDKATAKALADGKRLQDIQEQARTNEGNLIRLKAMLGSGSFTEEDLKAMAEGSPGDADMQAIEQRFLRDMSMFDTTIEAADRNYPALPEYLVNALRSRNEQLAISQQQATSIRTDAEADIKNARDAQKIAEDNTKQANERVETLSQKFDEDRTRMNQEKEQTRDELTKASNNFRAEREKALRETTKLKSDKERLESTVQTQKNRLNELTNPQFEVPQGEVRYVIPGGELVTINLGSADALRPNVTFGVIDRDEIRLQDAKLKANLQVTRIQGPHQALARVISAPEIRSPIIPGDKVYSPFWAPGRTVKIGLAGSIDVDADGRPDNEQIKGQIMAAGAEVVYELSAEGQKTGKLDASVRFLVIGEDPDLGDGETDSDAQAKLVELLGLVKGEAGEFGITIIPAWKLQGYLKTIDDTLTTPLGSGIRGDDFLPDSQTNTRRLPNDIADMYKTQEGTRQRNTDFMAP